MTTAEQGAFGGSLASKLVVVLLLALSVGLYLRIVMVGGEQQADAPRPQASVRIVEGGTPAQSADSDALKELPADQMQLIKQVFAPELMAN